MSHQFLLTFHLGLKQVSRTTHLNAQNNYNQISQELASVRNMAEDAEIGSRTSSTTRSVENWASDMAEDAEVGGNCDGGDDKTFEKSPSQKLNVSTRYLTVLRSVKMSSLDNLNHCWDSQLETLLEWLQAKFAGMLAQKYKEQNSCRTMQGSYPNQSLRKLTFYRYNKLSSCQVCKTYKLSWYHSTLIIKLQLLGTDTSLSGTSFLSLTL